TDRSAATPADEASETDTAATDDETKIETAAADARAPVVEAPVDPVIKAVRDWLAGAAGKVAAAPDDLDAVISFYGARTEGPLWVDSKGFSAKGKAAVAEVSKAADWGLAPHAFALPRFNVSTPSEAALAEAEARVSLELLKYARHARGGRI